MSRVQLQRNITSAPYKYIMKYHEHYYLHESHD